jgi:Domain of unknown function (DUF4136)
MPRRRLIIAVLLTVAGCGQLPKTGYDFDRSTNFGTYKTYAWLSEKQEKTGDRRADSSTVDMRIRIAVGTQLRLKGYQTRSDGRPDFFVTYSIGLKDSSPTVSSQYFSEGMAGHPFLHSADTRPVRDTTPSISDGHSYLTGTLLIDVIDAASQKLVWRGTAAGEVDQGLTSAQRDERTKAIVQKILAHFPPP